MTTLSSEFETSSFWRHGGPHGAVAIRSGEWKLHLDRQKPRVRPELFHLMDDLAESVILETDHPAKVTELQQRLDA